MSNDNRALAALPPRITPDGASRCCAVSRRGQFTQLCNRKAVVGVYCSQHARVLAAEGDPNNCATCDYKRHPDGGWCYMFRDEPTGVCMKHTRRRGNV